eukprot:Skav204913  [mRNA]  locus=scaffold1506:14368:15517:- [translate_table: standard]
MDLFEVGGEMLAIRRKEASKVKGRESEDKSAKKLALQIETMAEHSWKKRLLVLLSLLADKNRKTVIVQFETLLALRQSIVNKSVGRLKADPSLVQRIDDKVTQMKKEAQTEIDEMNDRLKRRKSSMISMLRGGGYIPKHDAKRDSKKESKNAKKTKKDSFKKGSGSKRRKTCSSDDAEDDMNSSQSIEPSPSVASNENEGESDDENSSNSDSDTFVLDKHLAKQKAREEKKKARDAEDVEEKPSKTPKNSSGTSASKPDLGDDDLWSHSRFTPESEKGKAKSVISDELMEMLSELLYANFKGPAESQTIFTITYFCDKLLKQCW